MDFKKFCEIKEKQIRQKEAGEIKKTKAGK